MRSLIGSFLYFTLLFNYAFGDSTDRPSRAFRNDKFTVPGDSDSIDPLCSDEDIAFSFRVGQGLK
ncbi:MAG: hypothetical protein CME70_02500 [Halobacteriovorax sp.]|nr:hypothetical protein [Halobacteriovorax sp.]